MLLLSYFKGGDQMTIGERLKQLREKSGMSQVDFATKLNISKQNLYKYENDIITNIPSDKIEEAAKILHVSPSYIMGWTSYETLPSKSNSASNTDADLAIIQRERNKMSDKEKTKLMNILKANFDEYNWEDDNSGNIE